MSDSLELEGTCTIGDQSVTVELAEASDTFSRESIQEQKQQV